MKINILFIMILVILSSCSENHRGRKLVARNATETVMAPDGKDATLITCAAPDCWQYSAEMCPKGYEYFGLAQNHLSYCYVLIRCK